MSWLQQRIEKLERRLAPSVPFEFKLVIDGKIEDEHGNWVPDTPDPAAEVIEIRASESTLKMLAENEKIYERLRAEQEERRRLEELEKQDAEPLLEDYPLPAPYVAKPAPAEPMITPEGRKPRGVFPADWSAAEETVVQMLDRLGY